MLKGWAATTSPDGIAKGGGGRGGWHKLAVAARQNGVGEDGNRWTSGEECRARRKQTAEAHELFVVEKFAATGDVDGTVAGTRVDEN
jgi:hypothetical protein